MQVTYAGMMKPKNRYDKLGFLPGQNLLTQIYYQSLLESKRDDLIGGPETFDQWLQRGPLYCFRFDRDSKNLATDVQTYVTYDPVSAGLVWPPGGCNLYLVAEYTRETKITRNEEDRILQVDCLNI